MSIDYATAKDTVYSLASQTLGSVHGDVPDKREIDIEFKALSHAVRFVAELDRILPDASADIRKPDAVQSLWQTVVLTVVLR